MILTALALLAAAPAGSAGHALILTNNRSLDASRPDLRYADDDGVKYAELLGEVLGEDHVVLLTELDPETRALFPGWIGRTGAPTRAALDRAVADLVAARPAEVWLVLAGHGDVAGGQGYLELADQRLYAHDLEAAVIAPLEGARVHLILDSCNSYFMLSPRKPGGARWATRPDGARDLLARHPRVGALISTSAEAITYEWSEVQSGIFSYEVRSGLRGAADADLDGAITYEELSAFLATTNRPIQNDLYRPKTFARGPADDPRAVLLARPRGVGRAVDVPAGEARRLTVRDRLGVRVLDVHTEAGSAATLHLPTEGALSLHERVAGERPTLVLRTVSATLARAALDQLAPGVDPLGGRGEAPVFHSAFAEPFGPRALEALRGAPTPEAPVYGIATHDVERLDLYLRATADYERQSRVSAGVLSLVFAGGAAVGGALLAREQGELTLGSGLLFGASGALAITGALALAITSPSEDLVLEYATLDRSTEAARGKAVLETEAKLQAIAEDYRQARLFGGVTGLVLGTAALGFVAVHSATADPGEGLAPVDAITLTSGGLLLALGVYQLAFQQHPAERTWQLYADEVRLDGDDRLAPGLDLVPTIGAAGDGLSLGLAGRF